MAIRFIDAFSRSDWVKITILLVVGIGLWVWVYTEMQKPILPPGWDDTFTPNQTINLQK